MRYRTVLKDASILFLGTAVSRGFVLLYRILAARELSIEDYADLSLFISFFFLVIQFGFFGVAIPLTRFTSQHRATGDREGSPGSLRAYYLNALILVLLTTTITVVALLWWSVSHGIDEGIVLLFMILGSFGYTIGVHNTGVLRGHGQVGATATLTAMNGSLRFLLLLGTVMFSGNLDLETVIIAFFVSTLVPTLISLPYTMRSSVMVRIPEGTPGYGGGNRVYDKAVMSELVGFSGTIMATNVLVLSLDFFSRFALDSFVGAEAVAVFDVAVLLYAVVTMILAHLVTAMVPHVSEAAESGREFTGPPRRLVTLSVAMALGAASMVSVLSPWTSGGLETLLGKPEYGEAMLLFGVMLLALPFHVVLALYNGIAQGIGEPGHNLRSAMMVAIVAIPLYGITAWSLGLWGVAVIHVASYMIRLVVFHLSFRNPGGPGRTGSHGS